jgi:hypothetical protein
MIEKIECKGVWFLPENPKQEVAGILYFIPNETIRLELIGSLSEKIHDPFGKSNDLQVIHGIVKTEKSISKITLFDCYASGGTSQYYIQNIELCLTNYNCSYVLFGKHLQTKEDLNFNRIKIFLPCLNDWYKDNKIEWECVDSTTAKFTITEGTTFSKKYAVNEYFTLSINGFSGFSFENQYEYNLKVGIYIELESSTKANFITLLETIGWFKDFYSLAAMTTMPFSKIYLYDNDDYYEIETSCCPKIKSVKKKQYNSVALFYFTEEKYEKKGNSRQCFLFDFKNIENEFETILQKWYQSKDNSKPIIQHLISSVTFRRTVTNGDFLNVIQAIEGYYNRFIKNNETLTNILTNLYGKYKDVQIVINSKPDINKVVDSRHYYSHILPEGKKTNVSKRWDLYELAEKLKPLLICCILTLIGFDNNKINALLVEYYERMGISL